MRALKAGADQLLMTPADGRRRMARCSAPCARGRISEADLDAKVRRVLELKYERGIVAQPVRRPGRGRHGRRAPPSTSPRADAITDRTTTLVKNDGGTLPLAASGKKVLVAGYGVSATQTLADAPCRQGAPRPR